MSEEFNEVDWLALIDDGRELLEPIDWFLWRKNTKDENRHWMYGKNWRSFDNADL